MSHSIAARPALLPVASARPDWVPGTLFPFTSRFVEASGARLHYVDEGSGPTLLMLHGGPMWSFMYRHAITELSRSYRCVAIDLPGLGLSQAPLERGRAFSRSAEWLQAAVCKLDLRDVTLLVHATAGPSGLEMAVREQARIRALVICNTFAWPLDRVPALWRFVRIVSSPWFGFLNVNSNLLPRVSTRKGRRTGPFSPEERRAILGPYRTRDARRHLQNLLRSLRTELAWFGRLEARLGVLRDRPTLLLPGAFDNGYRAGTFDHWAKLLPEHRLAVMSSSGHFPFEDEPARCVGAIADWLGSLRS